MTPGGNPAWTRRGDKWTEVRKAWGVGFEGNCVCVPAADFDNDGDLDLLLVNFYKNIVLYRNNTNDNNWIEVKPIGSKSNPDGIGAQVRLYAEKKLLGTRAIRMGRWKLVYLPEPWGADEWQLFDTFLDLSESRDLSSQKPELLAALKYEWSVYAEANNVILPDWVSGY